MIPLKFSILDLSPLYYLLLVEECQFIYTDYLTHTDCEIIMYQYEKQSTLCANSSIYAITHKITTHASASK